MLRLGLHDPTSIHAAVAFLLEKEGRIDVLVNNAGVGFAGAVEDASIEEIETVFRSNVFGVLECCRAVIPTMRANGGGWIVNISSIAGEFGLPFRGVYCASKSALDLFSETLRMELKPAGIRVSIVQPGDVRTNINNNRLVAAKSKLPESPYYKRFQEIYSHISSEVATAQPPERVARIIWKIIQLDQPRMRYPAGTFVQRLSLSINRVLPKHIFQKMLLRKYPVE
jgi:NAD(P)-dependent dehydrogenase (short-subunit alcohol dehydrogenase family)